MIRRVASKIINVRSKYKTPTKTEDPYLPALFVFQGMRGSGKHMSACRCVVIFNKKGAFNIHSCCAPLQRIMKRIRKKAYLFEFEDTESGQYTYENQSTHYKENKNESKQTRKCSKSTWSTRKTS